jgi:hypothetical protein
MLRGPADDAVIKYAAEVVAQHTKFRGDEFLKMLAWRVGSDEQQELAVKAASAEAVGKIRI